MRGGPNPRRRPSLRPSTHLCRPVQLVAGVLEAAQVRAAAEGAEGQKRLGAALGRSRGAAGRTMMQRCRDAAKGHAYSCRARTPFPTVTFAPPLQQGALRQVGKDEVARFCGAVERGRCEREAGTSRQTRCAPTGTVAYHPNCSPRRHPPVLSCTSRLKARWKACSRRGGGREQSCCNHQDCPPAACL